MVTISRFSGYEEALSLAGGVERLMELVVSLAVAFAELMREVAHRRVVAQCLGHLIGQTSDPGQP